MITLIQCFTQYQGTAVSADGITANKGQCPQWANIVLNQVYGLDYHYGNAIDWWNNPGDLLNDFDKITDGTIKAGDFVVYDARVGSVFGHIDVAVSDGTIKDFMAYDSNWNAKNFHDANGYPTLHEVHHNDIYNTYILGSLRRKDTTVKWNNGDTYNLLFHTVSQAVADQAKAANYEGFFGAQDGIEFKTAFYEIVTSLQYGQLVQAAQAVPEQTVLGSGSYKVN